MLRKHFPHRKLKFGHFVSSKLWPQDTYTNWQKFWCGTKWHYNELIRHLTSTVVKMSLLSVKCLWGSRIRILFILQLSYRTNLISLSLNQTKHKMTTQRVNTIPYQVKFHLQTPDQMCVFSPGILGTKESNINCLSCFWYSFQVFLLIY